MTDTVSRPSKRPKRRIKKESSIPSSPSSLDRRVEEERRRRRSIEALCLPEISVSLRMASEREEESVVSQRRERDETSMLDSNQSSSHIYVDLTNDSLIDLTAQSPVQQRHTHSHSSSSHDPPFSPDVVLVDHTPNPDSDVIIMNTPPSSTQKNKRLKVNDKTEDGAPKAESKVSASPSSNLSCPICLETVSQFQSKGRKLSTTICGHIFCNACIRNAIVTSHKCPSCRKTLTLKQYHQLYL